jgi:hypothetical protein
MKMNENLASWATSIFPEIEISENELSFGDKLKIHFLPISQNASFQNVLGSNEIVLWEDIWHHRQEQVKARIGSLIGTNKTISARETLVRRIDKPEMDVFLDLNHLMDVVSAKHKYGLIYKGVTVAIASFSAAKTFYRNEEPFRSVELVRFASIQGVNVVGGLGKILEHFVQEHQPDDIMTYTDREWSTGEVYEKLGFEKVEQTPPLIFWVHPQEMVRYQTHRLPKQLLDECAEMNLELDNYLLFKGFCRILNRGNNKFLWKLK